MWSEFPAASAERWRQIAERECKGASPDRLAWTTPDGLKFAPTYFEGTDVGAGPASTLKIRQDYSTSQMPDLSVDWIGLAPNHPGLAGVPRERRLLLGSDGEADALELDLWTQSVPSTEARCWLSSASLHNSGATPVKELGYALGALIDQLRRLDEPRALRLDWVLAVSSDLFTEVAKLRAARRLLSRVYQGFGLPCTGQLHAVQSRLTYSQLDPETNLLRSALATIAASVGGASSLRLERFNETPLADRMARNQPRVVTLEGYLGKVQDPFAGSRFLEDYTDQLARAAWTLMQAGHDRAAAETEIALSKNQRIERLALGKDCLVGVNRYAAPQSTPTPSADWRLSTPFEALRRPGLAAVLLLEDAPPRARVDFVRQTLAVAGIECREVHTADEAVDGPEPILVLCSPDDHHAEAIPRLRAATPKQFGVAGQPKVAGADFYLHLECNRLELLGELVSRC